MHRQVELRSVINVQWMIDSRRVSKVGVDREPDVLRHPHDLIREARFAYGWPRPLGFPRHVPEALAHRVPLAEELAYEGLVDDDRPLLLPDVARVERAPCEDRRSEGGEESGVDVYGLRPIP